MAIQAVNVMTATSSLLENESGSDGTQLSKEDNDWDIWN